MPGEPGGTRYGGTVHFFTGPDAKAAVIREAAHSTNARPRMVSSPADVRSTSTQGVNTTS